MWRTNRHTKCDICRSELHSPFILFLFILHTSFSNVRHIRLLVLFLQISVIRREMHKHTNTHTHTHGQTLLAIKTTGQQKALSTSFTKFFAILRRTSGASFGTRSEYSPMSHKMLARAIGTVMVSVNLAMWLMISLCAAGYMYNVHNQYNIHCQLLNWVM